MILQLGSPPSDPIIIDHTVDYKYVIPVQGETSIAVAPLAGFVFSIAGRVLTFQHTADPGSVDLAAVISISVSDGLTTIPQDINVRVLAADSRAYPAITSAAEIQIANGVAITDYVIAADNDPDSFAVLGLPPGFVLTDATISGTPVLVGDAAKVTQFQVVLLAIKGDVASYRYLLLNVTPQLSLDPDFILDIGTRKLYATSGPAGRADRMEVVLGDSPQLIGIQQNAEDFIFPATSKVRLLLKTLVTGGDTLIDQEITVEAGASEKLSLGEDWLTAGLIALDFVRGYQDLWAQYQWRFAGDPAGTYRKTKWFPLRLWANLAGGIVTGGASASVQSKPFSALAGNVPTVSLDSVLTLNLAVDTWLATVVINDGGVRTLSTWMLVAGTEATADGIQRGADYTDGTNEKIWVRVA